MDNSTVIKEISWEKTIQLKQQAGQDILITGSATLVQSLMEADLIDGYRS